MKKLLLLTLAASFAMPQAFALFRGKTAGQIEQEQGTILPLKPLTDKLIQLFPELEELIPAGATGAEKFTTIVQGLLDILKGSFQNLQSPLLKVQPATLTVAELRGLINALNAYANNKMGGLPRLAAPLDQIYNAVRDTYKGLVQSDAVITKIGTIGIGQEQEHKLADAFLQSLIFSIVQGKTIDELLPLITHSLEMRSNLLKLQPAKGSSTAGYEQPAISIPSGDIEINY